MSGLTSDQLAFYRTEGYLLVENVINPAVFDLPSSPKSMQLSIPPLRRPTLLVNWPTCTRTCPLPSA